MANFTKFFKNEDKAFQYMVDKNRATKRAGSKDIFAVVPGPDHNYAVVDLNTAIDLGLGYTWSF